MIAATPAPRPPGTAAGRPRGTSARRCRPRRSRGRRSPRRSRRDAWRSRPGCRRPDVVALETAHLGLGKARREPGSSPGLSAIRPQRGSRATSSIGAKVMVSPSAAASAAAARAVRSHKVRIEGRRLGQWDREDGAVAVDHVEGEQQRHAEAGLLDRDPLHLAGPVGAPQIADGADPSGADRGR